MKVLLDIKDDKATFFMEVLKNFSFVKIKPLSDQKAQLIGEIKEAVENLKQVREGKMEAKSRAENMVAQMDAEGFGACTNTGACAVECPKEIGLVHIARLNREYYFAKQSSDNMTVREVVHEG